MLPRERQRNHHQRLIPLTPQLIQDMLEHENFEYQTPPGGHRHCSTTRKISDKLKSQISSTNRREHINCKLNGKSDIRAEDSINMKLRDQQQCLDVIYPARSYLKLSSNESSTLESLMHILSSGLVTKTRIKRYMEQFGSRKNEKQKTYQWNCGILRNRRSVYYTPPVPVVQCQLVQGKRRRYTIMAYIITILCISVGLTRF